MEKYEAEIYQEAYRKGLSDGMKQLCKILIATLDNVTGKGISEIIEEMFKEQKRMLDEKEKINQNKRNNDLQKEGLI